MYIYICIRIINTARIYSKIITTAVWRFYVSRVLGLFFHHVPAQCARLRDFIVYYRRGRRKDLNAKSNNILVRILYTAV